MISGFASLIDITAASKVDFLEEKAAQYPVFCKEQK
jgi:hypothetical protein